jgi:hypothetical protein
VEAPVEDVEIEEQDPGSFTGGEKSSKAAGSNNDPLALAKEFLTHRAASVEEEVASALVLSEGLVTLQDDASKLEQFLQELAKAKVLTDAEVAEGLTGKKSKSTISKLKKIKENSVMILHPDVVRYLQPGYSVLYELALLCEELKEASEFALFDLIDILNSNDGPITRRVLKKERDKLKPAKASTIEGTFSSAQDGADQSAEVNRSSDDREDRIGDAQDPLSIGPKDEQRAIPSSVKSEVVTDAITPIAAVLMTPNSDDVARLVAEPSLWVGSEWLNSAVAVLLVEAKLGDLLAISDFVSSLSFARCSHIYLLTKPQDADLINRMVLAVFERGGASIPSSPLKWPKEKVGIDLANRLLDGVEGRRVHVFAEGPADGWESVVGDDNWQSGQ